MRALAGGYKMLHAGGDGKNNGVGIIVTEKIRERKGPSGKSWRERWDWWKHM